MKIEWNDRTVSRIITLGLACSIATAVSIATVIMDIRHQESAIGKTDMLVENTSDVSKEQLVIPFDDRSTTEQEKSKETDALQSVYDKIIEESRNKTTTTTNYYTVTTTTQSTSTVASTTTTKVTSASVNTQSPTNVVTEPTAGTEHEGDVSNGKDEFNYNDVSAIAEDLLTLGDFAEAVMPTAYSWDTDGYDITGNVRISMISDSGTVTLDVKPTQPMAEDNTIDGQSAGSVSDRTIAEWSWYSANKDSGCSIVSISWLSEEFAIPVVRSIGIGSSMSDVTENYLCVNGGASVLYKSSDVIKDADKLNSLLSAENIYTFVGGRVFSISSYLAKYYSGQEAAYRFADGDYVIQYGCNSIMEYDYTTGSWIIEYAIKGDKVEGITFMNKSYNEQTDEQPTEVTETDITQSTLSAFLSRLFS